MTNRCRVFISIRDRKGSDWPVNFETDNEEHAWGMFDAFRPNETTPEICLYIDGQRRGQKSVKAMP